MTFLIRCIEILNMNDTPNAMEENLEIFWIMVANDKTYAL